MNVAKFYILQSTDCYFYKRQKKKLTRSIFSSTSEYLSKQNILPALCIFCRSKTKEYKQKWMELRSCLTHAAEIDIRQAAKYNDDQELLKKEDGGCDSGNSPDFTAVGVKYYHQPCKSEYLSKRRSSIKVSQSISIDQ